MRSDCWRRSSVRKPKGAFLRAPLDAAQTGTAFDCLTNDGYDWRGGVMALMTWGGRDQRTGPARHCVRAQGLRRPAVGRELCRTDRTRTTSISTGSEGSTETCSSRPAACPYRATGRADAMSTGRTPISRTRNGTDQRRPGPNCISAETIRKTPGDKTSVGSGQHLPNHALSIDPGTSATPPGPRTTGR